MNYVGQLAGQVFVTVKELYKGLNPATLSGCIDIIVVRQPDGSLQCSPFHVRFGKMGVLRSLEKLVDIEINCEPVGLHMKLGENGEAFFVEETEDDKEIVPSHLATSPILSEGAALLEAQMKKTSLDRKWNLECSGQMLDTASQAGSENPSNSSSVKKRRKRRRKSKIDSLKKEDMGESSEDEDMFQIEMSSDEENEPADSSRKPAVGTYSENMSNSNSQADSTFPQSTIHPHSDGEWSPSQSPVSFRPDSPKSDSELVTKHSERTMQQMDPDVHWAWGELPQTAKPTCLPLSKDSTVITITPSENTHFRVIQCVPSSESLSSVSPSPPPVQLESTTLSEHWSQPSPACASGAEVENSGAALMGASQVESAEGVPATTGNAQIVDKVTDSPSKKKDKRSRHLGSDGVYLDDLTGMDPEVAALYFPKSGDGGGVCKNGMESGARSANQSPQSVGSSGMDSGIDGFSDQIGDLPSISVSLCGGLTDNKEITPERFLQHTLTYQQFSENPCVIDDPNLVVKIGNKYYNWATAAPMLLAMQAFQKPLPKATIETIMRDKMPKKGGRWWFSWRGRNTSNKVEATLNEGVTSKELLTGEGSSKMEAGNRVRDESSSSDEDPRTAKQSGLNQQNPSHLLSSPGVSYRKTLRLTSDQLKSLQLKDGPNDVVFSVTTQYQGTCRCEGTIYLWNWDDKIIISDIDGTITRSDTLGHILPTLGKDWTHQGIAKLYHKVSQNGYKFMYCSARAIGMAGMTRGYLHWVNERGTVLPQGPVLLSPSSLFSALHREVIEKKPEKFKIECLTDIKNLFYPNEEPFYAAFGNRPTDVYAYKEVGVPLKRIFTVNPKGELIQEHAKTNISSYTRLCDIVDHVFPVLKRGLPSDFPCSDTYSQFTYWREPLLSIESHDLSAGSE
ncbi:phosphatidate phosphatase LPIN1 isoform X2 [Protopterus annectens]|uniref:phosphatidate phosphatase LPIN1 isoform X2 n=2 Tax=Protopterus annectens TaxID=7888 RepID=UPI001CFBFDF3|nr:phosphatidate phosphatase LPIN1 isoform X2 [Protopterus annectens]